MLRAAEDYYRAQARLSVAAQRQAARAWSSVSPDRFNGWDPRRLAQFVAATQLVAAQAADGYTDAVLAEQDLDTDRAGTINALAFAGVAGDGRPLPSLLDQPRIGALTAIRDGLGADEALAQAGRTLQLMAVSAVQDAARGASGAALVARPRATGWVRMLQLPSCSRCVVLAGKFFRWNTGFLRHPRCDCRHIPSTEALSGDLTTDPRAAIASGQVTGLSAADRRAILEHGTDVSQVVNSRRGMTTTLGRKTTTEGTTVRGDFGRSVRGAGARKDGGRYERATTARLRPEAIYAEAQGDRAEATRLLRRFGYLT